MQKAILLLAEGRTAHHHLYGRHLPDHPRCRGTRLFPLILASVLMALVPGVCAHAGGPQVFEDAWSLNPEALARFSLRDLQLGSVSLSPTTTFGIRLQEEPVIPDLGSEVRSLNPLDASAIAQDIQASSNRLLAQYPRRNALRMNWLQVDTADYRIDLTQHPSRMGLRFHHVASGLRIEAERRFINGGFNLFVGIRLAEDRRFEPTVGCSYNSNTAVESRTFCGFRLRIGI